MWRVKKHRETLYSDNVSPAGKCQTSSGELALWFTPPAEPDKIMRADPCVLLSPVVDLLRNRCDGSEKNRYGKCVPSHILLYSCRDERNRIVGHPHREAGRGGWRRGWKLNPETWKLNDFERLIPTFCINTKRFTCYRQKYWQWLIEQTWMTI